MPMTLSEVRDVLEVLCYGATIIGIPVGITVFMMEKRRERLNKEIEAYLQTCDRYMTFLQDILENPDQACGDFRGDEPSLRESGFTVKQITLFQILFMNMEQVFTIYTYCHLTRKNHYWTIWMQYFEWWAARDDFQKAWEVVNPILHPDLKKIIDEHIRKHKSGAEPSARPHGSPAAGSPSDQP